MITFNGSTTKDHVSVASGTNLKNDAPEPIKLYLATFSPAMTDSRRKLYFESLEMRRYAIHGVIRSAGSCTNTGIQFPSLS